MIAVQRLNDAQPILLNLYDTHFLPLQENLRPITKSFIIALLPGLEEENGEYFDKVRLCVLASDLFLTR